MNVKITINSEDRIVLIPMDYDKESDVLNIGELQIEPLPDNKDDINKDIVLMLAGSILSMLKA